MLGRKEMGKNEKDGFGKFELDGVGKYEQDGDW